MNEYYKMVGEYYDTDALDFDKRYWQNPILQRIRQDIRENLKNIPFDNALEIGCGTGIDITHFGTIFPEKSFIGIDVSNKMVNITNKKNNSGKITIQYKDLDQFELISNLLTKN